MNMSSFDAAKRPDGSILLLAILLVTAFVPFALSMLGISRLHVREFLVPGLFLLTLLDFAVRTKNPELFFPGRDRLHLGLLLILFFAVIVSYIRNPVGPASIVGENSGGFKTYWRFICGFMTYLMVVYWINRNQIPVARILDALYYLALTVVVAGFVMLVTGLSIPGLDTHTWSVNVTEGTGSVQGSLRIPFLERFSQIGFLLVLINDRYGKRYRWPLLGFFLLGILVGGGRAGLLSTAVGIIIWLALNRRYLIASSIVFAGLVAVLMAPVLYELVPSPQLKRFVRLGPMEESSTSRHYIFKTSIEEFVDSPVFGTGFGKEYDIGLIRAEGRFFEHSNFINDELRSGEHTTHLQLLKNLGLVGYVPFLMLWLYPLFRLRTAAMSSSQSIDKSFKQLCQFCLVLVLVLMIRMVTEGNGSETRNYFLMAFLACAMAQAARYMHGVTAAGRLKE